MQHPKNFKRDSSGYVERSETGRISLSPRVGGPIKKQNRLFMRYRSTDNGEARVLQTSYTRNITEIHISEILITNVGAATDIICINFGGVDTRKFETDTGHNLGAQTTSTFIIRNTGATSHVLYPHPRLFKKYREPNDVDFSQITLKDEDGNYLTYDDIYIWYEVKHVAW